MAMVWRDCSAGHRSDHGADRGADHGADRDNGFLIGGMVAGMQIPSCFVVTIVQGCVRQKSGLLRISWIPFVWLW